MSKSKRDELVGVPEAAAILKLSPPRIKQLAKAGRIGQKIVGRYLFTRGELADFAKIDRPAGRRPAEK